MSCCFMTFSYPNYQAAFSILLMRFSVILSLHVYGVEDGSHFSLSTKHRSRICTPHTSTPVPISRSCTDSS